MSSNKSLIFGTIVVLASALLLPNQLIGGKDLNFSPILKNYSYFVPGNDSILAPNELSHPRSKEVIITGYSSTECQTDDTPFITASGETVRPGIAAANWLPFGTKIMIPELFDDRIFIIEDRMHPRNDGKIDIWFESREEALMFGINQSRVEIL